MWLAIYSIYYTCYFTIFNNPAEAQAFLEFGDQFEPQHYSLGVYDFEQDGLIWLPEHTCVLDRTRAFETIRNGLAERILEQETQFKAL